MQTARYFRLALLGATLLSTPVLAATNDQANNPPANNTAAATTPAPANNMAATMTPAKNNPNNTAVTNPPPANNTAVTTKAPDGVLHKYDNEWRASKLVGANVYNEQGQTVASINDLLVTDDGHIDRAVLSTGGGILGVGSKLVTVPFNQLKFEPSANNNNTNAVAVNSTNNNAPLPKTEAPAGNGNPNGNAATTANSQTAPTNSTVVATNNNNVNNNNNPENFSIVLPGATQDSLKNEQEFKFAAD